MMRMNRRNTTVFLLLFLCASHAISFAAGASRYHIPCIDDAAIKAKIPEIEKKLKINTALRYAILGVGATAGVAATTYMLYDWLFAKKSDLQVAVDKTLPRSDGTPVTFDVLRAALKPIIDCMKNFEKQFEDLQQKAQDKKWPSLLRLGKSFITFGLNSIGSVLIWNFVTNAQRHCRTIFKSRDLKWFIAMQTHLGAFIEYEDMEGALHERFNEGTLLQELNGIAKLFDKEVSGDAEKTDQLAQMLRSASKSLIDEVTGVVAFMQHAVATVLTPTSHEEDETMAQQASEAISYAHYLQSHANTFAHSVEQLIEKKLSFPSEKTDARTTVQKFIADFTSLTSGFNRIMVKAEVAL